MIHGASTTVFLRLKNNTLYEFARVDTGNELTAEVIRKDGEWHQIYKKPMNPDNVYTRYMSFNPPVPYK